VPCVNSHTLRTYTYDTDILTSYRLILTTPHIRTTPMFWGLGIVCIFEKYNMCVFQYNIFVCWGISETQYRMSTGWRKHIGSPKLQIIFHKRATKYRSILRKLTYKDMGSYESSPPCSLDTRYHTVLYVCSDTPHTYRKDKEILTLCTPIDTTRIS